VSVSLPIFATSTNTTTTRTASISGHVSGQPLIVAIECAGALGGTITVTDTFATPYTWTQVIEDTVQNEFLLIGTGGSGSSGTVTISNPADSTFGLDTNMKVFGCAGASLASGLSAIDNSAVSSGSLTSIVLPVITPSVNGCAYIAVWQSQFGTRSGWTGSPTLTAGDANGAQFNGIQGGNPASGVATSLGTTQFAGIFGAAALTVLPGAAHMRLVMSP
jgi:hypothetical protein